MVFLIQATQNRDADAIQIKLDEVIRALKGAHNAMLDLEELEEEDLVKLRDEYLHLAERARVALGRGKSDTDVGDLGGQKRRNGDPRHRPDGGRGPASNKRTRSS